MGSTLAPRIPFRDKPQFPTQWLSWCGTLHCLASLPCLTSAFLFWRAQGSPLNKLLLFESFSEHLLEKTQTKTVLLCHYKNEMWCFLNAQRGSVSQLQERFLSSLRPLLNGWLAVICLSFLFSFSVFCCCCWPARVFFIPYNFAFVGIVNFIGNCPTFLRCLEQACQAPQVT